MTRPAHDRHRTPGSSTGRRKRPAGWHGYSTLPRSRVPVLLSIFWMSYAVVMTAFDLVRGLFRRRGRKAHLASVFPAPRIDYTTRSPTPVG